MILAKAPLRISIGGGGTDLPSYYERFESTFVSAAINKYIYIGVHPIFVDDIVLKYSEAERASNVNEIRHPIFRECLRHTGLTKSIEITSIADIPSGTGLGSSGTFTVSLLKALYTQINKSHDALSLAEDACKIEIEKLGSPVGKQDQYIASVGGLTKFHINKSGVVTASPLMIEKHDLIDLEEHLLIFFTGYSRSANLLLKEQDEKTKSSAESKASSTSNEMIENLHFAQQLGFDIVKSLEKGQIDEFGRLMHTHWEHKKKRSKNMSSGEIDNWYELGIKNGAFGGKLIGAGGGGFLMFLTDDKRRLRQVMREAGLHDVPFKFDFLGAQVVLRD